MNALTTYLKEAYGELRKVSWPTKKQTVNYSLIVIGMSLAVAAFFGLLDFVFNWLLQIII